jgi:hypothetical protein
MSTKEELLKDLLEATYTTRPLCSDHRDKQTGSACLACRIESLRRALERIIDHATKELPEHEAPLGNRLQVMMGKAAKALRIDEEMRKFAR